MGSPSDAPAQRLVFGETADDYDRYRPSYPDELVDLVLDRSCATRVLDVGCGTAKFASALARRGVPGHAVEPDPAMAAVARRNLPDSWSVEVEDFERCAARGRTDWPLITCAQAWHWIDADRGFAHAARLLAPGGTLALFWNRPDFAADDLRAEMDQLYDRHAPDMQSSLRGRGAEPRGVLRGNALTEPPPGFSSVEVTRLRWEQRYSSATYVGLLGTHSDHRLLAPAVRDALHRDIGAAIDRHGGSFVLPYDVELVLFRLGS